jgi:micrococcal nuclease
VYEYGAQVTRVVDGDTVHARVDLGCDVRIDLTIRLYGINAPEMATPEGAVSRDWLSARLDEVGGKVTLRTIKDKREKYGRYLGILIANGVDLNSAMVSAGLARVYLP